ncbi:MAG: pyridoxal phosphate-dependent aminotransferase [Candidatus Caenarcaniphilales bacterium]|nr:pyridoxal phosphate-dependent aminotransferase [Candidatus Caenarcaniphilales bacterium]
MHFNNFELEDLYNKYEKDVDFSISSACLDPLSINGLYDLVSKYNFQNKRQHRDLLSPQQANWVLRKSKETQSVSEPSPSESENSYEPSLLNNSGYDAAFVTHHISASPNQGSEYSDVRNKKHDFISKQKFFENLADFKIDYSSKFGLDIFQDALKNKYGNNLNFLSTSGASEAIVLTFTSLFVAGDKIVVQKPIYASLYQIAKDMGVEIIDWDYDWSQDFEFNYDALRKIFNENNDLKALVINNPNNPTGGFFNNEELNLLVDLIKTSDAYLIADEVFKDLVNPGLDLKSVASLYEKGISIADVSKSYGLQGLRTGWLAVQDFALREQLLKQKNYFSLRTPILGEYLAAFALDNSEAILSEARFMIALAKDKIFRDSQVADSKHLKELVLAKIISFCRDNLDFKASLEKIFNEAELGLDLKQDRLNGLSCFIKLSSDIYSVQSLFEFLIQHRILLVPGRVYGVNYMNYFRLGLIALI